MATARRLSISLLISTLLFVTLAIVAYSGLFPWIEVQFYSPRVTVDLQKGLGSTERELTNWKATVFDRFRTLLSDSSFDSVFVPTQSREAIQKRNQSVRLFLQNFHGPASLRILDETRDRIHFSTVDSDILAAGDFSVAYKKYSALNPNVLLSDKALDSQSDRIFFDPLQNQFYFLAPFSDKARQTKGYFLGAVSSEDLRSWLFDRGLLAGNEPFYVLDQSVVLISKSFKLDKAVIERVKTLVSSKITPPAQKLAQADGLQPLVLMFSATNPKNENKVALVLPQTFLELNETLKLIILASFFSIVFLLSFLLFSVRGDPLVSVSRKVKRFQLQVVKEYLDQREKEKIFTLRDELSRHSDKIKQDIRKSLGKVRKQDSEWVEEFIDRSWQEVLDLLGARFPTAENKPPPNSASIDWQRLEKMLHDALAKGHFVVSGTSSGDTSIRQKERNDEGEEVEPLEELEEVEDAEPVEDLETVEELDEVEEVEDLEEIDEAEAAEEAEEVEELESLDSVDDAEAVEEISEIAETVATDETEELEELEVMEENESSSPKDLEELPVQNSSADLFRYSGTAQADAPLGTLEEVEDLSVEAELEPVDDDEPATLIRIPERPTASAAVIELVSFDLDELDKAWGGETEKVFDENDEVVTISAEVFGRAEEPHDELGRLVQGVTGRVQPPNFQGMENDLIPERIHREWRWTGGGFDWDRFTIGESQAELYKALTESVAAFDAFSAAILTLDQGVWVARQSVGFSDLGKEMLKFGPENDLFRPCLQHRALHILNGEPGRNRILWKSFHARDLKFLRAVVLAPILHEKNPSWLLLGLKSYPEDPLSLLKPRTLS